MTRIKNKLGQATVEFVNGEEQEIEFYTFSNYEMMQLKKKHKKVIYDRNGILKDIQFDEGEFLISVMMLSTGNQLTLDDWKEVVTDLKSLYDKHLNPDTKEKNCKSSDMSDQSQEQSSEA